MCRIFRIHRSGFYAWLDKPLSNHAVEDQRLLKRIKEFYIASGGTYGSPWIHRDLLDGGEACSVHRVARIMRKDGIRSRVKSKFKATTNYCHNLPVAPNLITGYLNRKGFYLTA